MLCVSTWHSANSLVVRCRVWQSIIILLWLILNVCKFVTEDTYPHNLTHCRIPLLQIFRSFVHVGFSVLMPLTFVPFSDWKREVERPSARFSGPYHLDGDARAPKWSGSVCARHAHWGPRRHHVEQHRRPQWSNTRNQGGEYQRQSAS